MSKTLSSTTKAGMALAEMIRMANRNRMADGSVAFRTTGALVRYHTLAGVISRALSMTTDEVFEAVEAR